MAAKQKTVAAPKSRGSLQRQLLARIYVVVMLCLFPLYLNAEKYFSLTKHKAVFFFVATILAFVGIPILFFTQFDGTSLIKSQKKRFSLSFAGWALAGFLFVTLLSSVFTPYPGRVFWGYTERYDGLMTQLLYAGIFCFVLLYYRPREWDFAAFAISSILVSAIGILQYYEMDFLKLFPHDVLPGLTGKTIIFRTTLGNIDVVSSYLSITVVFFGILYARHESKFRLLYLAAGAINTYMLVVAGAEAGIVGALAAFVLCLPFVMTDLKSFARLMLLGGTYALMIFLFNTGNAEPDTVHVLGSRWFLIAAALLVFGGALLLVSRQIKAVPKEATMRWVGASLTVLILITGVVALEHIGKDPATGTLYQAREMLNGNMQDEFGSYRGYVWNRSIQLLKEDTPMGQLLIGSGPDTFVDRFETFKEESTTLLNQYYDKAHNEYLQILICQGILGLAAYLAFLGAVLLKAIKPAFEHPLLLACLLACVSYLVQAFFSISLPISAPALWILLGIAAMLSRGQGDTAASGEIRFP